MAKDKSIVSPWGCKMMVNGTLYSCDDLEQLKQQMYLDMKERQAEESERFKAGIEDFLDHCKCNAPLPKSTKIVK